MYFSCLLLSCLGTTCRRALLVVKMFVRVVGASALRIGPASGNTDLLRAETRKNAAPFLRC